ncbi:hypothetical protein CHS0354_018475 [Potamilus streckersoni]|uniref:D-sedoheptulose-7-phosphate isomerase n=1 Tax=Potamilus streckersoni TaxID=2493646 RepID=A0AAE0TAZ9_9BIVA|nr:hypothetical protein CHS0354_018475 [Potamilus streckersoni]
MTTSDPAALEAVRARFEEAQTVLEKFMAEEDNLTFVAKLAIEIDAVIRRGGKIISFGNGGSMCDAMHFAEELTGRFRHNRTALPAVAVSDPSHLSCVANDFGYEYVFSRFVEGLGKPGDAVIGLSTSGNSPNVLRAFEAARRMGIRSFALTGKDGGACREAADEYIVVPSDRSERIQEIHIKILHTAIDLAEESLLQSPLL